VYRDERLCSSDIYCLLLLSVPTVTQQTAVTAKHLAHISDATGAMDHIHTAVHAHSSHTHISHAHSSHAHSSHAYSSHAHISHTHISHAHVADLEQSFKDFLKKEGSHLT
jgi:hypothetical protein